MYKISDTLERKFVDSIEIADWEIENEEGWVDVTHLNVTIPYEVYQLITTNCSVECADNHIVFTDKHQEIFVKNLKQGDFIIGQNGIEEVLSVVKTDRIENMYDLSVTGNHTFYAEGLLHHNTVCVAAYLCWFVIFNDEKTCVVLANKATVSREILSRIQLMYENLPKFLQQGIVTWNKGSFELENRSRILSGSTSSTGYRGFSVSLLYCVGGESEITVRNKNTGEIKKIQIEEFSEKSGLYIDNFIPNNDWEILTKDGFKGFSGIKITDSVQTFIVKTKNQEIRCSANHLFLLSDGSWIALHDLKIGVVLDGGDEVIEITESITSKVYDPVNVDGNSHYLIGSITNHNCDEYGFVPNNVADEFYTSMFPTLSSGKETKMIISSTPNGYNHFQKIWNDAENKNSIFVPVLCLWNEHPERDATWAAQQLLALGEVKYNQEVCCLGHDEPIKIRDKKTGIIRDISIGKFYSILKLNKSSNHNYRL